MKNKLLSILPLNVASLCNSNNTPDMCMLCAGVLRSLSNLEIVVNVSEHGPHIYKIIGQIILKKPQSFDITAFAFYVFISFINGLIKKLRCCV